MATTSKPTSELVDAARRDYGDLVSRITTYPEGLGIDVHLMGGEVIQYSGDGTRYPIHRTPLSMRLSWRLATLRATIRRILATASR